MNAWLKKQINSIRQQRSNRRGGLQGNGGFTLVELIVVLIVLGILVSLAVMGLRGWQDYADFKQNNEAAKNLFTAAQIQLTQYGERGQLSALKNEITNDGKEKSGYLLSEEGINDNSVWQPDADSKITQTSQIYYLKAEKGDYQIYRDYLKGKSTKELKDIAESGAIKLGRTLTECRRLKALFDMLDPYIADKSILDAAICIEFAPNPKVAQVYSAFYNPKLQGFTYRSAEADNRFASIDKDGRSIEKRKEKQVGYYGVDVLSVGTDNDLRRPIINNVRLNNEDTLNLSWAVSLKGEKGTGALEEMFYSLDIYRVEEDEKETRLGAITLGTADKGLNIQDAGNGFHYVNARYEILESTDADGTEHWKTITDGKETANSEMSFPIRVNKTDGTIALTLDAVDVSADESADAEDMFYSTSIERLKLDADNICIYISGKRPGVYETTKTKRSNTENQYFGLFQKENLDSALNHVCTILNVRHLNNIRYYDGKAANTEYRLLADLDWMSMVNRGVVYRGAVNPVVPESLDTLTPSDRDAVNFRPILSLGVNSRLTTTESDAVHTLKNFQLLLTNVPAVTQDGGIPENTVGLFVLNQGTVENLAMEDVRVRGAETGSRTGTGDVYEMGASGAFCGVNQGALSNLAVQSGTISGDSHVGGILGAIDTGIKGTEGGEVLLTGLLNRAEVKGNLYVGGIAGSLIAEKQSITLKDCANYGAVTGEEQSTGDGETEAYYIGGIAGYAQVADMAAVDLKFDTCTSSPLFDETRINEILQDIEESIKEDRAPTTLSGIYVGGIVGLNRGAIIENCDTLRETAGDKGYVIGKRYVGGIAGFNEGTTGIIGGDRGRNQAQIIGQDFVGGIVGCNAIGSWEEGKREVRILSREEANMAVGKTAEEPEDIHISNWINEGAIIAVGDYAGGITGYNLGQIRGCNSAVEYSDEMKNMAQVTTNSRYAGGIVGYNGGLVNGRLKDEDSGILSAVSVISGKNFVGGIAGYNDVGGAINNYELRGGYIRGEKFVGGFIGLNADESVFETRVYSNPNEVVGEYFAGGILGANLVPTDKDITARFKADNFLGSLHADEGAFVGGYIGYNYLLKAETEAAVVGQAVNALCEDGILPKIQKEDDLQNISGKLQNIERPLEQLLTGYENTVNKMTITGETIDEGALDTQMRLGNVSALVYAGGVIGYNQKTTVLEIKNVENITLIEATAYIEREESGTVTDSDGNRHDVTIGGDLEGSTKRYSYAGGIIGRVAENVTLENCKNRDVGEVRAQGTYTGGLAELNEGKILNCEAGSLGDGTRDYIGGLAGVNLGIVENCSVSGTIMGNSRIGGLVSENYGQIINPSVGTGTTDCYIEITGQDAGGVAGYGFAGSSVTWDKGADINININGSGRRVGGVIGTNEGTVMVTMTGNHADQVIENRDDNSIIGYSYVGGFIGVQKGKASLENMHNHAEVQAEQGFAGGIAAWVSQAGVENDHTNAAGSMIRNCRNIGTISVLRDSDEDDEMDLFPGTTAENEDDEKIEAEDDDLLSSAAGGITAVNFGNITECVNNGIIDGGNGYGGGIAALNYGKITYSRVGGDSKDTLDLSGNQYVGGITAKNKPDAVMEHCAVIGLELQNRTFTAEGYMGGVTGENLGKIENCTVGVYWEPENREDGKSQYTDWHEAAATGVMKAIHTAGAGKSDISYTLEDDNNAVTLISNSADVSMGGVAGINRFPEEAGESDENGTIMGIRKDNHDDSAFTVVLADLGFAERSQSYYGNIGGVAGINQGTIQYYEFNGFIHGTANNPANAPEYNPNYDYEQTNSAIYGYGGIAGLNGSDRNTSDARINHCMVNMARVNGIGSATNRTNVGGVAGVNGTGAQINHIWFGNKDRLDEMYSGTTKFFVSTLDGIRQEGNVWVGTDDETGVGHVGGVVGYNQGTVSRVNDWGNYEENRERYFTKDGYTDVDNASNASEFEKAQTDYSAVIINSTGHTGGIVGYNRRTGTIQRVVTGRRWIVGATKQEQDNGTGGIIGYNISEQNLEYCDNHAKVFKMIGNSVGGIIGRNENATTSSWRIYDCRNYGEVKAQARSGGILGQLKYKGGTFEKCENYGKVTANNDAAGGILAMSYGLNLAETINFVECRNFGDIGFAAKNVPTGGIMGQVDGTYNSGRIANFYNCINTGLIGGNGGNGSAGILGLARSMKANFYYCRNYGYNMNGRNNNFGGIYYSGNSVKMTECFGVTDRTAAGYPIAQGVSSSTPGGYYFAGQAGNSTAQQNEDKKFGIPLYVSKQGNVYTASSIMSSEKIETLGPDNSLENLLLKQQVSERQTNSLWSYRLYLNADKYLVLSKSEAVPERPEITEKEPKGGHYRISWTGDIQTQYYNVEYVYYIKNADGTIREIGETDSGGQIRWSSYTTYTNYIDVLTDYSYGGETADGVKIRVRAVVKTTGGNEVFSEWSEDTSDSEIGFGIALPIPRIHWELVRMDQDKCYRIVLDNKSDYEELKKAYPNLDLSKITITTWLMQGASQLAGTRKTFTVEQGALVNANGSYELLAGYNNSNRYLVAYASTSVEGFDRSAEGIREGQLPARSDYLNGNGTAAPIMANAKLNSSDATGFFGDTMTSLYYQTTLTAVNPWGLNYRTELVAVKNKLGIPVAYAVSPFTRTSPAGTPTSKIVLTGLPNDFLDKESADADAGYVYDQVRVRMYPTKMSNNIFFQGWQVKLPDGRDTMTLEELSELRVTTSGQLGNTDSDPMLVQEKAGKKTLQPGYVIEYAGEDEYTLYYNTLLREMVKASDDGEKTDKSWEYNINNAKNTYRYRQVFYHPIDLDEELKGKGIQPEPIAYVNARTVKNSEGDMVWEDGDYQTTDYFTLTWDQAYVDGDTPAYGTGENQHKVGAKYLLSVDGVSQRTTEGDVSEEQLTPIVTNAGFETENKAGYNTWAANSANWSYDSIRVTLTRLGETGSNGITNKFPATYTKDYPLRKRMATIGKPAIANKTVDGEIQKDGLEYVISWTGIDRMNLSNQEKANQQDAFRYYEVVVEGQTSGTVYTSYTAEYDMSDDSLELDFSKPVAAADGDKYFYQGEKISVTVSAIARKDRDSYRDGITSAALETDIPIRLEAPDMGKEQDANPDMTAVEKTPLSVEAFEKGCITLRMKRQTGVKYQIALQIFENQNDAENNTNPVEEITGLPEKSDQNRIYMNEQADVCTYTVTGIPAKYAGKWLRVVLRGVSDNSISSVWTEDDTDMEYFDGTAIKRHNKVEPYRLFQLPAVQVDSVKMAEPVGTETKEYALFRDGQPDSSYFVTAVQNMVSFTTVDYATDYQINIIQTPQTAERTASPSNAEMVVSDVIQMKLVLNDDGNGYTIEYQSSELSDTVSADGDDKTAMIERIPLIIGQDAVVLPYKKVIPVVETDDGSFTLQIEASIKAERDERTGKTVVSLTLPDAESIEETTGGEIELPDGVSMEYTEQILIQSLAENDSVSAGGSTQTYYDSNWAAAVRTGDRIIVISEAIPTPVMAADGSDEPSEGAGLAGAVVKESDYAGFAYELEQNFNGTTRYLLRVTDESDNLLGVYGVPYNRQTSKSKYVENIWLPIELASDAGRTVKLNFASIFSLKKGSDGGYEGGLSLFSEQIYEIELPPVTPVTVLSLAQYISDPIVCETTVSGKSRTVLTKKVTAKQRQIEWIYHRSDTKTTGYELMVRGENMAEDYTLELDLTKNEFGRFKGLDEYMTAEGKVLYSVAYNLEGDMIPFITDVPIASSSDAVMDTATGSDATPANAAEGTIPSLATSSVMEQPGILILNCTLRAEQKKDEIKFILTLPDAAIGQLRGNAAEQYQNSEFYYDGGLYNTEQILVQPVAVNPFYELSEQNWAAVLHSYRDEEESGEPEADSEDGELRNNLNQDQTN